MAKKGRGKSKAGTKTEPNEIPEDQGENSDEKPDENEEKQKGKKAKGADRKFSKFPIEQIVLDILKDAKLSGGVSPGVTEAVSDLLVAVMGSVPSYSVGETMISASNTNSLSFANAVANQQRNNIVGMVATIGCVTQLLDMRPDKMWKEIEIEDDEET